MTMDEIRVTVPYDCWKSALEQVCEVGVEQSPVQEAILVHSLAYALTNQN